MKKKESSDQVKNAVIKREKIGPCNICKSVETLTWDHVPPQGGTQIHPMQQQTIMQNLATCHGGHPRYSISQNGVKFRTICGMCNNTRLGRTYDPVLNEFRAKVVQNVTTTLILLPVVQIETNPRSLIRAVFGHLLAAKGKIEDTVPDQAMRAYFLDETLVEPEKLKVFYWVHPYHNVVIIRDVAMPAVRGRLFNETGFFSIIKFFPLGFLVSDLDQYEGLNELTRYARISSGNPVWVPVSLIRVEDPRWPEIVDDTNLLAGGQSIYSSILAEPRNG
jgi:hypothetical protein